MKTCKVDNLLFRIVTECIVVVLLLIAIGNALAVFIHNTSLSRFREIAATLLPQNIVFLHPERDERIIFMILCLCAPLIIAAAYHFMTSFELKQEKAALHTQRIVFLIICKLILLAGICSLFSARIGELFFEPVKSSLTAVFICLIIAGIWLYFERGKKFSLLLPRPILAVLIIGLPILQILCSRLYTLRDLHLAYTHHLEVVTYAIAQAAAGKVELDQYGFYPQFLAPLFQLTGTSVFNISVIMGVLYLLVFLGIMDFCAKIIHSRFMLAGLAVVLFLTNNTWGLLNDNRMEPIFAYYPVRMIFPVLAILLFYKIITSKPSCKLLAAAGAVCGTGLMWNPESGIPGTAAFAFFLLLQWLQNRSRRGIWQILCFAAAGLAAVVIEYLLLSLKNGAFIDLGTMSKYPQIFYELGYMMLRLPSSLHPWQFVLGIYLLALILGLRPYLSGEKNSTSSKILLFLAILGTGLFTYYQGRSCDFNLSCVIWPAVIIAFIFCDRLFRSYRAGMLSASLLLLSYPLLLMVMFSAYTVTVKSDKIGAGLLATYRGLRDFNQLNPTENNTRFILNCTGIHRDVNIYGDRQGIYYAETGLRSGIADFNLIEIMLASDQKRIFNALANSTLPLIVLTLPEGKLPLPNEVLRNYRLIAINDNKTIYYFEPLGRQ
jgi:hypothetical protein